MKKLLFVILLPLFASCSQTQAPQNHVSTVIFDTTEECQKDTVIIMEDGTPEKFTWNKKYQLLDVRTMDSNANFKLVIGISMEDLDEIYFPGGFKKTILIEDLQKETMYRVPKDVRNFYLCDDNEMAPGIPPYLRGGQMSHSTHNGFPRYIFMEGNDTGLDDEIWCLDTKKEALTFLSFGHGLTVLENDNIRISISVVDDKTGDIIGEYDQIITPTGEIVWKEDEKKK